MSQQKRGSVVSADDSLAAVYGKNGELNESTPSRPAIPQTGFPKFLKAIRTPSTALLFLLLGWTIFASSQNMGLAVSKGFLIFGASPLFVFALAALSVVFLSHLVMQSQAPNETPETDKLQKSRSIGLTTFLLPGLFLAGSVSTLFFIFTMGATALGPNAMAWSMPLAAISGVLSWYFANRAIDKVSGPYMPLAMLLGVGIIVFSTLWILSLSFGIFVLPLPVFAAVSLGLTLLFGSAYRDAKTMTDSEGKNPKTVKYAQKAGKRIENVLFAVKFVLMAGFMLLAFLSIAMVFQLGHLGLFSGMLDFAFNEIVKNLGYSGFQIGTQWMSAFFIAIFSTSGFIAFKLQESLSKTFKKPAQILFKFSFNSSLIVLLMLTNPFLGGSNVAILPMFLVLSAVTPLFSSKTTFLGGWFSVNPLPSTKNLNLQYGNYIAREVLVAFVLLVIPTILFLVGIIDPMSMTVMGFGVAGTMIFRWGTMGWDRWIDPSVVSQSVQVPKVDPGIREIPPINKAELLLLSNQQMSEINGKKLILSYDKKLNQDARSAKVIKIEVHVTRSQRRKIERSFADKRTGWKDAAPHYLLMRAVAAYRQEQITPKHAHPAHDLIHALGTAHLEQDTKHTSTDSQKAESAEKLAKLIEDLSQATHPLYSMVNNHHFEVITHPDYAVWNKFKEANDTDEPSLKVAFLRMRLENYNKTVQGLLDAYLLQTNNVLEIQNLYHLYQTQYTQFLAQLENFSQTVLMEDQLRKLFGNQNETDDLSIISLGGFLRTQAHYFAAHGIHEIDRITEARFDQLFAATAHPLRRKFVNAKSDLAKQLSTHAVRYHNTSSAIPKAQLEILRGSGQADGDKRWFDLMPYIKAKEGGIDGSAGLNDLDAILRFYLEIDSQKKLKPLYCSKSSWIQMFLGKEGFLGIFLAILAAPFMLIGVLVSYAFAMLVDLIVLALRIMIVLPLALALTLLAIVLDMPIQILNFLVVQLPWWVYPKWPIKEINFSFLDNLAHSRIMPDGIDESLRSGSLVRILKQYFLDKHKTYEKSDTVGVASSTDAILSIVKKNQAEGLFNTVGTKIFSVSVIAAFVQGKIKQFGFSVREFFKVLSFAGERLVAKFTSEGGSQKAHKKQHEDVFAKVGRANKEQREMIRSRIQGGASPGKADEEKMSPLSVEGTISNLRWPTLEPWQHKEYATPMDFLSEISLILMDELVNRAFQENPGIATPAFAFSMASFGSLLMPHLSSLTAAQIQHVLQAIPGALAKNFMGKELVGGMNEIVNSTLSVFLQFKFLYFSIEGLEAIFHGDIEFLEILLENPEEITLGAVSLIALGYGIGMIPEIPPFLMVRSFPNPLLICGTTIVNAATGFVNLLSRESAEVAKHGMIGPNALELAFLGLKSSMLVHMLVSSMPNSSLKRLEWSDEQWEQLIRACIKKPEIFDKRREKETRIKLLREILEGYLQSDTNALVVAEWVVDGIDGMKKLDAQPLGIHKSLKKDEEKAITPESKISPAEGGKNLHQAFIDARNRLQSRLKIVRDMEVLGIGPSAITKAESEAGSYQSKNDAEFMFDGLSHAFEEYNKEAEKLGLLHENIDGEEFLHNFYNKYCHSDSSGLQKLLTFLLISTGLPLLWWGFKWWLSDDNTNPTMRQEVRKTLVENVLMLLQIVFDVFAPIIRSLIKSVLYTFRMVLGILLSFVYPYDHDQDRWMIPGGWFLLPAVILTSIFFVIELAGAILDGLYNIFIKGASADEFVQQVSDSFGWFSKKMGNWYPWDMFKQNVNPIMAFLSRWVGGIFVAKVDAKTSAIEAGAKNVVNGALGLHRVGLFTADANQYPRLPMGVSTPASWYERLTHLAGTNSEDLSQKLGGVLKGLERPEGEVLGVLTGGCQHLFTKLAGAEATKEYREAGLKKTDMRILATLGAARSPSRKPEGRVQRDKASCEELNAFPEEIKSMGTGNTGQNHPGIKTLQEKVTKLKGAAPGAARNRFFNATFFQSFLKEDEVSVSPGNAGAVPT